MISSSDKIESEAARKIFGDLLSFHLRRGTRPPSKKQGTWKNLEFGKTFGASGAAVGQWCLGRYLPQNIDKILDTLFGDDPTADSEQYAEWRKQLREAWDGCQLDQTNGGEEAAAQIAKQDQQAVPQTVSENLEERAQKIVRIPVRAPKYFVGREAKIEKIDSIFSCLNDEFKIVVLCGLRGVGKTVLAATYSERRLHAYRVVWWINARSISSIRDSIVELAMRVGWAAKDEISKNTLAKAMEMLCLDGNGILLIYDNAISVDVILPYLPMSGASNVIITSNSHAWRGIAEVIEILPWSEIDGAQFLTARIGRPEERTAAKELSRDLGGLPLAHEQAASYCEHVQVSLSEYHRLFQAAPIKVLNEKRYLDLGYSATNRHDQSHSLTVARTFQLAIEELKKRNSAAPEFLFLSSILPAEPIPIFLFEFGRDQFVGSIKTALTDGELNAVIESLLSFSLIDCLNVPDEGESPKYTRYIRIHRLVREVSVGYGRYGVFGDSIIGKKIRAIAGIIFNGIFRPQEDLNFAGDGSVMMAINPLGSVAKILLRMTDRAEWARYIWVWLFIKLLPSNPVIEVEKWKIFRKVRTLAMRFAEEIDTCPYNSEIFGYFLYVVGNSAVITQADDEFAEVVFRKSMRLFDQSRGSWDILASTVQNDLANIYNSRGRFIEADQLLRRCLSLRETKLGGGHAWTATCLHNLGSLNEAMLKFEDAVQFYKAAIDIRVKCLGRENESTAASIHNLGVLYRKIGRFEAAHECLTEALEIRKALLGDGHPETAYSLEGCATLLQEEKRYDEAQLLFEKVVTIRETWFGPNHPHTVKALNNLCFLLYMKKAYEEAGIICIKNIESLKKRNFSGERDLVFSVCGISRDLAEELADLEQYSMANLLFEESISLQEATPEYGEIHLADVLNSYAHHLQLQGRYEFSKVLFMRALKIYESKEGNVSDNTKRLISNIAFVEGKMLGEGG